MAFFSTLTLSFLIFCQGGLALEMDGQTFSDKMKFGDNELVLNGLGVRKARFMGFTVKVYVGGLYVKEKSSDPEKLISSETPKVILLKFVRKVDKEKLTEAWKEGVKKNCRKECDGEKWKPALLEFNKAMVDVKKDSTIEMHLLKDSVKVIVRGRVDNTEESIASKSLGANLMAVFLGQKPPNKGLKKGLLGLK